MDGIVKVRVVVMEERLAFGTVVGTVVCYLKDVTIAIEYR